MKSEDDHILIQAIQFNNGMHFTISIHATRQYPQNHVRINQLTLTKASAVKAMEVPNFAQELMTIPPSGMYIFVVLLVLECDALTQHPDQRQDRRAHLHRIESSFHVKNHFLRQNMIQEFILLSFVEKLWMGKALLSEETHHRRVKNHQSVEFGQL